MFKKILFLLLFAGITLNATIATEPTVTKLYIATFDRAPDATGLEYWIESGLELENIAISFFAQTETQEKYPDSASNEDFINSVYWNLFRRSPDSVGLEYWSINLENQKVTKSLFILSAINGALGDDAEILNNKTTVGLAFAKANRDDAEEATEILLDITKDKDTVDRALCQFDLAECIDIVPEESDEEDIDIEPINNDDILADAFENQTSDIQVNGGGSVTRILSDDNEGSRHQRFILELASGQTLLMAHNIDLAPRISSISLGDTVEFFGEYEWNSKGGVIHWTHKDPNQNHIDGWLKHDNITYQ